MSLKTIIEHLLEKQDLQTAHIRLIVDAIEQERFAPEQLAAVLVLLRAKQETSFEIRGFIEAFLEHAKPISIKKEAVDLVGTGGDGLHTMNITTASSIVVAACGYPVIKHGGRASSSKSGSADLLESLGIELEMSDEQIQNCLDQVNIAFLYAPYYHPLFSKCKPVRKALRVRTCFNILGPLLNPAKPPFMVIGTYDKQLMELMSDVICLKKPKRALVFAGPGIDEFVPWGKTNGYLIEGDKKSPFDFDYGKLPLPADIRLEDIKGGSAKENALLLNKVFSKKHVKLAVVIAMNAALGILVLRQCSLEEAFQESLEAIENGSAMHTLNQWVDCAKYS